MSKIVDNLELLKLAIEDISKWDTREQRTDGTYTDISCRLNVLTGDLVKLNEQLKGKIKAALIEEDKTISEGHTFLAVITRMVVQRLDTEKVKRFLGRRLKDFQVDSPEVRLSFKPKG